ncbi:MAG: YkgJ family cysteine cluster protein [Desulfobacterales bacterium]|nr:YkgJ family cysteine cluster protein [Desulfobacterales bacterium]
MEFNLTPYFEKYEELVATTTEAFNRVKKDHSDCVKCEVGCADCCHALFDLTLIEALYINHKFKATYPGEKSELLLERANRSDRKVYKIKKKAHDLLKEGCPDEEILERIAAETVRCALLNDKDLCDLYEFRPITCRLYGVPTAIGGKGHTCGLSGFSKGKAYPTANLDRIQSALMALSNALVADLKSKYTTLGEMLVPLSMALLTDYNDEYLGLGGQAEESPERMEDENE